MTTHGKLPIGHQFILVNFDPCFDEPHFSPRQAPFQHFSLWNRKNGFIILIASMDMRTIMPAVVHEVHGNGDAVTLYTTNDRDQGYTFDGLQRLKNGQQGTLSSGAITSRNFEQDFTLDQLGNWPTFKQDDDGNGTWDLDQSRSHNLVNELTDFTTTTWFDPAHDAAGNMTTMPQPLAPSSSFTATYDAWNRLVKIEDGMTIVSTYEYDGLNRRIRKDLPDQTDDLDYYYNENWQLLAEAKQGAAEALYAWHPYYIDALALRFRAADRHFFLHDDNFNVTAAYDVEGGSGTHRQVVERYAYTPYGEPTVLNDDFSLDSSGGGDGLSDIGNVHLYTGRERDPETGLQLNRNRFYHNRLVMWLTRDPIGYEGSDRNLYGYARSRPLDFVDPSGELGICPEKAACQLCGNDWVEDQAAPPCVANGCTVVADHPAGGSCSFRPCCDIHDTCYCECDASKHSCDVAFLQCMRRQCARCYPNSFMRRYACYVAASIYFNGVAALGDVNYCSSQSTWCMCQ